GVKMCLSFLNRLQSEEFVFQVMKRIVGRLIDAGRFDEINEILDEAQNNENHIIAIVSELEKVGLFTESKNIEKCLHALVNTKKRIDKSKSTSIDITTPTIIAFLESCLHRSLDTNSIL